MKKAFVSILLILALSCVGKTQKKAYYFQQVEGLASNTANYHIFKDHKGFVWISSNSGLSRFDGRDVKLYLPKIPVQSSIFEDAQNRLWVSSSNKLHEYDVKADSFLHHSLDIEEASYRILHLDQNRKSIILGTSDSVYQISTDNLTTTHVIDTFGVALYTQFKSVGNTYYLSQPFKNTRAATRRYNWKDHNRIEESYIEIENKISYPFIQHESAFWIGTEKGLIFYNPKTKEQQTLEHLSFNNKPLDNITRIIALEESKLLVAAKGSGIFVFDTEKKQFISEVCKLNKGRFISFPEQIDNLYLDPDGVLWVSVANQGVYFTNINNHKFDILFPDVLHHPVSAIERDLENNIWCSTANELLIGKVDDNKPYSISLSQENTISDILHHRGQTWFASLDGTQYVYGLPSKNNPLTQISDAETFDIHQTSDALFVSSIVGGIECFSPDGKKLDEQDFFELKDTSLYLSMSSLEGPKGTLLHFFPGSYLLFLKKEAERWVQDTVLDFTEIPVQIIIDQDKTKYWLATYDGLWRLEDKKLFEEITFPAKNLQSIIQANDGTLWLANNKGIWQFNPRTKQHRQFMLSDGLLSREFLMRAVEKTQDGKLIFGSVNGANIFDPNNMPKSPMMPAPLLTEILVNNIDSIKTSETAGVRNASEITHLVMPRNRNTLTFKVAIPEYITPKNNRIQYRLLGVDTSFLDNGIANSIRYTRLSPGNYTLELRALHRDGSPSEHITKLDIIIKAAWYETWYFRLLAALFILAVIYAVYRRSVNREKEKAEKAQRIEKVKRLEAENKQALAESEKIEAERQREKTETEMAILRLQMNPHFLFNAMTSIKQYIDQKPDSAKDFLGKFSAVMRKVLNIAKEPYTFLDEEIALLTDYLEVEKLRFPSKLNYKFEYDAEDLQDVSLPTMLLQPFVENAILHGIATKENEGLITIRFIREGEYLRCEVEDNGDGLHFNKKKQGHESKATKITLRRLELLEETFGLKTELDIINLREQNPIKSGVLVQILMPLLE